MGNAAGSDDKAFLPDEEGSFLAGSVRLYRRAWFPTSRRGVMVIQHGLRDHSGRYGQLARELNRAGMVVHAMDLRGHGKSEGAAVYTPSFEHYLQDLERFFILIT
jgi:alpha-beta hydrolase superfamily lysophospholipase